jgi:uncharacterized protein YjiK
MKILAIIASILVVIFMFMMLVTDLYNERTDYPNNYYLFQIGKNKYDLKSPKKRWKLPSELKEISGITLLDDNTILCIQDEDGTVYSFDLRKEKLKHKIKFGKPNDYEDIAIVKNTVYVLKSDGQLHSFALTNSNELDAVKFSTPLSYKNNTEGLAYDAMHRRLLIACKESPSIHEKLEKGRAVYAFDLDEDRLIETPVIFISKVQFMEAIQKYGLNMKKHVQYQPSGIAIHPSNGEIVIICSLGKILILLDPQGNIERLVPLDPELFVQPEGICFGPDGDLFIASEGKQGKGYILKF